MPAKRKKVKSGSKSTTYNDTKSVSSDGQDNPSLNKDEGINDVHLPVTPIACASKISFDEALAVPSELTVKKLAALKKKRAKQQKEVDMQSSSNESQMISARKFSPLNKMMEEMSDSNVSEMEDTVNTQNTEESASSVQEELPSNGRDVGNAQDVCKHNGEDIVNTQDEEKAPRESDISPQNNNESHEENDIASKDINKSTHTSSDAKMFLFSSTLKPHKRQKKRNQAKKIAAKQEDKDETHLDSDHKQSEMNENKQGFSKQSMEEEKEQATSQSDMDGAKDDVKELTAPTHTDAKCDENANVNSKNPEEEANSVIETKPKKKSPRRKKATKKTTLQKTPALGSPKHSQIESDHASLDCIENKTTENTNAFKMDVADERSHDPKYKTYTDDAMKLGKNSIDSDCKEESKSVIESPELFQSESDSAYVDCKESQSDAEIKADHTGIGRAENSVQANELQSSQTNEVHVKEDESGHKLGPIKLSADVPIVGKNDKGKEIPAVVLQASPEKSALPEKDSAKSSKPRGRGRKRKNQDDDKHAKTEENAEDMKAHGKESAANDAKDKTDDTKVKRKRGPAKKAGDSPKTPKSKKNKAKNKSDELQTKPVSGADTADNVPCNIDHANDKTESTTSDSNVMPQVQDPIQNKVDVPTLESRDRDANKRTSETGSSKNDMPGVEVQGEHSKDQSPEKVSSTETTQNRKSQEEGSIMYQSQEKPPIDPITEKPSKKTKQRRGRKPKKQNDPEPHIEHADPGSLMEKSAEIKDVTPTPVNTEAECNAPSNESKEKKSTEKKTVKDRCQDEKESMQDVEKTLQKPVSEKPAKKTRVSKDKRGKQKTEGNDDSKNSQVCHDVNENANKTNIAEETTQEQETKAEELHDPRTTETKQISPSKEVKTKKQPKPRKPRAIYKRGKKQADTETAAVEQGNADIKQTDQARESTMENSFESDKKSKCPEIDSVTESTYPETDNREEAKHGMRTSDDTQKEDENKETPEPIATTSKSQDLVAKDINENVLKQQASDNDFAIPCEIPLTELQSEAFKKSMDELVAVEEKLTLLDKFIDKKIDERYTAETRLPIEHDVEDEGELREEFDANDVNGDKIKSDDVISNMRVCDDVINNNAGFSDNNSENSDDVNDHKTEENSKSNQKGKKRPRDEYVSEESVAPATQSEQEPVSPDVKLKKKNGKKGGTKTKKITKKESIEVASSQVDEQLDAMLHKPEETNQTKAATPTDIRDAIESQSTRKRSRANIEDSESSDTVKKFKVSSTLRRSPRSQTASPRNVTFAVQSTSQTSGSDVTVEAPSTSQAKVTKSDENAERRKAIIGSGNVNCSGGEPIANKYVGAHLSITDGLHKAVTTAADIGARALGMFLKSQRCWAHRKLGEKSKARFKSVLKRHNYSPHMVVPHGGYLTNMASGSDELRQKSIAMFIHELQLCEQLDLPIFNFHPEMIPGSTVGDISAEEAISRVAGGINTGLAHTNNVIVVIETMAGQGYSVGGRFEELRDIIGQVHDQSRIGVCFDTCHVMAAGYDLSSREGYEATIKQFDDIVGFKYLRAVHVNDSRGSLGSQLDQHADIATGSIGMDGFRMLMNDPRFEHVPMILETPGGDYEHQIQTLYDLCDLEDK